MQPTVHRRPFTILPDGGDADTRLHGAHAADW